MGTRPDAIKSCPVYLELRRYADEVDVVLASTGQHREMLAPVFEAFEVQPDIDLNLMAPGQSLASLTARACEGLDRVFSETKPDLVFAQGDTTTTFVAALAAFYHKVPFAHIEAGLRTSTIDSPFPEEFNRRATALVTRLHFAPTQRAAEALGREGVPNDRVFVTGNTGIDAVLTVAGDISIGSSDTLLLTTHRRENWGEPQAEIARACLRLIDENPGLRLVVPMHRNPTVRETLQQVLGKHERIELIEPPGYAEFVKLLKSSRLVLTDSGGVQEEAPSLGVPILILRESTERPEGVESGNAILVGTDEDTVFEEASRLLADETLYQKMSRATNPYGDGLASKRIRHRSLEFLGITTAPEPDWQAE